MFRPAGDCLHASPGRVAQDVVRRMFLIGPDVRQDLRQRNWLLSPSAGRHFCSVCVRCLTIQASIWPGSSYDCGSTCMRCDEGRIPATVGRRLRAEGGNVLTLTAMFWKFGCLPNC